MRKLICSFAAALMVGFSAMADEGSGCFHSSRNSMRKR